MTIVVSITAIAIQTMLKSRYLERHGGSIRFQTCTLLTYNAMYLPKRGNVIDVAGITSMTIVKYRVCDTSMAMIRPAFSRD
jgi:hypothetical protein